MLKTRPLCTGAESNLIDRVLGEMKKIALLLCQAKGGHSGLVCHTKLCVPIWGGFGEEFYSNGSRAELLIRLGCVHFFNLTSHALWMNFSCSFNLVSTWSSLEWRMLTNSIAYWGFSSVKSSKILLCESLGRTRTCPRLHYCFLNAIPLSLQLLLLWSATVGVFTLGLRGGLGSRSLSPTDKKWGTERLPMPGSPQGVLLFFRLVAPLWSPWEFIQ